MNGRYILVNHNAVIKRYEVISMFFALVSSMLFDTGNSHGNGRIISGRVPGDSFIWLGICEFLSMFTTIQTYVEEYRPGKWCAYTTAQVSF